MDLIRRLPSAMSNAFSAFSDTMRDPALALSGSGQVSRIAMYDYLAAWYNGTVFYQTGPYKGWLQTYYRLYRHTRLLWNPIPDIVNFWSGIIYPGNLSTDGLPFPTGKPTAVPFSDDTPADFALAAAQIMTWSNWQNRKSLWPRYGSMVGNALLMLQDPMDTRKVYMEVARPSHVASVNCNPQGDVLDYALEYKVREDDAQGREYTYRLEVDARQKRTYKNKALFAYDGVPAVLDHPYPFCPAVWVKHQEGEGIFGTGCIKSIVGTLGALAEINGLESQIDDAVRKDVETITVLFTDKLTTNIFDQPKRTSQDLPTASSPSDADRESKRFLKGDKDGRAQQLGSLLDIQGTSAYMETKRDAFMQAYPEARLYPQLRAMSQVTGPAAEILLGDVANPVREIRANYDRQLVKALQMCVTMGAINARFIWPSSGNIDDARQKFLAFSEQSFQDGQMNCEIGDRPLIPDPPLTEAEKYVLADQALNKLGLDEQYVYNAILAIPKKEINRMLKAQQQEQAQQTTAMAALNSANAQAQTGQNAEQVQAPNAAAVVGR